MKKIILRYWPLGFIFFIWIIFSSPYIFKGLVPFPSKYLVTFFPPWNATYGMPLKNNAMPDVITQIYPWKKLTIDAWKQGQIPLWNPYSFAGTPHLANYQSAVLSPFNLLFLILPMIDAWSLLVLLQPLLAGIFMYLFLKELGQSDVAGAIGSIAFMFCGFIVVWMAYGTLGYAVLFLPLVLWAMRRNIGLLVSAGLAISFYSGHFQISIYVALFSLAYAFFLGWKKHIAFWLAGIFLAMPQILPAYEAYGNAVRSTLFAKGEIIPWQYLVTLFAPDFFGNPVTRNDWFGHYAEWASFFGVVPLMLALFSLLHKKIKHIWFFGGAALITVLLAYPTPLSNLLFALKIPVLSTSAASRIIVLASFSLAVLSGFGFDILVAEKKLKRVLYFGLGVSLFFIVLWGLLLWGNMLPPDKLLVAKRNFLLPTLVTFAGLMSFVFMKMKMKSVAFIASMALLLLTSFDMLRFTSKWIPFDPREFVYPKLPVIEYLEKNIGNYRAFGNVGNELGTYFGIGMLEGYDAVYQRRYGEFISALSRGAVGELARSVVPIDKHGLYTEDAFQLLGVRYVLHRISDGRNIWAYPVWNFPHYTQVYKDEQFEVYENMNVYPRAFLATSYVVGLNDEEIFQAYFDKGIDRRQTLVLEERPEIEPEEGEGSVDIISYEPTQIAMRIQTSVPKLLFLSDSYHSGWQVVLNGAQKKLLRANYAFRAVSVPAGEYTVEFLYKPKSFILGIRIALVALIALLFSIVLKKTYAHWIL